MARKYRVFFEPDEDGWWSVRVAGVKGCRTQAKSIQQGLNRIREALALFVGDQAAEAAELEAVPSLDGKKQRLLEALQKAQTDAEIKREEAASLQVKAAKSLTKSGLSTRDVGELIGVSHQRVAKIMKTG